MNCLRNSTSETFCPLFSRYLIIWTNFSLFVPTQPFAIMNPQAYCTLSNNPKALIQLTLYQQRNVPESVMFLIENDTFVSPASDMIP
eukprot:TRINITY_DN3052_c3_g1_i14.p1 TRINITY_DN3052_c3_g1~~TRINITY_DN3052_c3_g1_i14.p1  ORF type:complete len:87 (-),score=8.82 TRINITY_DN3052_c3_g1_i14:677-937(-)